MKKEIEIMKFSPCSEAVKFRMEYPDFETAWDNCPRGDWMLWIASKLNVDLLKLTTAKALCANTVRHLMQDERSVKAIDVALSFGKGEATVMELEAAADAAAYAANAANAAAYAANAANAAADAAAYAANAANAAAYVAAYVAAAYAANAANAAAYVAAAAAAAADAADAARTENQLKTSNICRQILTEEVLFKMK